MTLGYFGTSFDIAKTGSVNLTSSVQPSSANELANKAYVDAAIAAGGGDWFASVLDQLNAAPASPAAGARYLVGAAGSGTGLGGLATSSTKHCIRPPRGHGG